MLFRESAVKERAHRLHGHIILAQPFSNRVLAYAIGISIGIAATWFALAEFTRTESVSGILTTINPSIKIIASAPGVVSRLSAAEGLSVKAGQALALISAERTNSIGTSSAAESLASVRERVNIGERQIILARDRALAEQRRLQALISSEILQISELERQIALQREVVQSNQKLFDQLFQIVERGFVSRVEHERRRQALLGARQMLGSLQQQILQSRSEIAQARAQLSSLTAESASRVEEIRSSIQTLVQQTAQLHDGTAYIIKAPVSGRVAALQTAPGRTVTGDAALMTIIPQGARVQAELYAPSRAIGFVKVGQEARLLFDAFPYQRFGSFGGRVSAISRTIIDARAADVPIKLEEPVYRVTVQIDRQSINAYGQTFPFQPGMTLTANLILERQSFLDWLLAPVRAVANRT